MQYHIAVLSLSPACRQVCFKMKEARTLLVQHESFHGQFIPIDT